MKLRSTTRLHLPLATPVLVLCMTVTTSHAATIVYGFSGTANPMVSAGGGAHCYDGCRF